MVGERTWGHVIGPWGLVLAFLSLSSASSLAGLDGSGWRHVVADSTAGVTAAENLDSYICSDDRGRGLLSHDTILSRSDDMARLARIVSDTCVQSLAVVAPLPDRPFFHWGSPNYESQTCFLSSRSLGLFIANGGSDHACGVADNADAGIDQLRPCLPEQACHVLMHAEASADDNSVTVARPVPSAVALGGSGLTLVAYWRKRRNGGLAGL